jgi:hypothetical protein
MYVIKNVFDNIIGTLLNISRKMKDGLKSRNDLVQFGLKPELHPKLRPNEKKHSINACMGCEYPQLSHPTSAN